MNDDVQTEIAIYTIARTIMSANVTLKMQGERAYTILVAQREEPTLGQPLVSG